MWKPNVAYDGYYGHRDYRRASYTPGNWMNWMNRLIKETNVDVDSSAASTSAPRSTTRRGNSRSRRTCVTTSLVGIAFVLLLFGVSCVPLVLYFVEKDQYKYYKADASITFQGTYNESLGDLSTQTSIDFQQDFCRVMEQTQAKKFKETYNGCLVAQIKNGSVIVEFTMYYYAKVTVQSDEVKSEITIYLKTNLTTTFTSKFNITVDVNSLTLSLLQTGEKDYQSGTSDFRFKTSLLTSTTEGTPSTLVSTISSNADNATKTETTVTLPQAVNTTVPLEATTTDTPAITTVPIETTTTDTTATNTKASPKTTTTDTPASTTTAPPETMTTDTPTTTTTVLPETTTTDTPTATTTVPTETTTLDKPASTTTAPSETTTTDTPATRTSVSPETTTTDTPTTTTTVPTEATTTDTPATTTTVSPETITTDSPTTTTTAPPEITTTDTLASTTTVPPQTTTDISTTTTTAPPEITITDTTATPPETATTVTSPTTTTVSPNTTATTITTYSLTSTTIVPTDTNTTSPPTTMETISDTTISHSSTTTIFITTSSDNDTTTSATTTTTATTTIFAEPFAVVVMKNSIGEIGKQAYIPCTINITSGDWVMIYIYQTHNDSIEPKIATISKNETITVFTSDPLLIPTFDISGSQIEAVVTFNFSNSDSSKCLMRLYSFTCSVEMTTGITFNASAELSLIAPLIQPTVVLHGTLYLFNGTANVSLVAIDATCNATNDRSTDITFTIAMRIQNVSGDDIDSFAEVMSYNVFTETCGELVFIHWSEVFNFTSDLNGSSLTCYVQASDKTVTSESITLTFLEQQNPNVSSTENPAIPTSTNTDIDLTTILPDITTTDLPYTNNYTQPSSTVTASQNTTNWTLSTSDATVTSFDTSTATSLDITTNNPTTMTSTEISTTTTTTTQVLLQPHAAVVMKNSIGEIGRQAYIPCTVNILSGDWAMIYIYQTHNDSIEPKIATISYNGTKTVFTSDPLLMPTFNISGSQIEAVVTFNFSNYDYSGCLMRQYRFICSVEMTTGSTYNASAEFNLIAPLIQPTVILHRTQYMFNETANVSLAAIDATCNATQDRSTDIAFTIAMRIQNVSGDDIDSFADVNSYNVFTETCGELVFIHWSEVFNFTSDLNGSSLTCYVQASDKTVTSENINLTFLEQQMTP